MHTMLSMCLLSLLLLSAGISYSTVHGGAVYTEQVGKVTLKGITALEEPPDNLKEPIRYVEKDKTADGQNIVAVGGALKTYNHETLQLAVIVGRGRNESYNEGRGRKALFRTITGFTQVNLTHVLIVDSNNHCLRFVNRQSQQTMPYAGICETSGYTDASLSNATFNRPQQVITLPSQFLITDYGNRALREIIVREGRVSTWQILSQPPIAITSDEKSVFVTTPSELLRINLDTKVLNSIISSATPGFNDGPLRTAQVNNPHAIQFIGSHLIIADTGNNRLRILDQDSKQITSICNGMEGMLDGNIQECELLQPLAIAPFEQGAMLIGVNTTETRLLNYITEGSDSSGSLEMDSKTSSGKPSSGKPNQDFTAITMSIVIFVVVLIALSAFMAFYYLHRRKQKQKREASEKLSQQYVDPSTLTDTAKTSTATVETNVYPYGEYEDMEDPYHTFEDVDLDGYSVVEEEKEESPYPKQQRSLRYGELPKRPVDINTNYYTSDDTKVHTAPDYLEFDSRSSIHYKI